LILIKGNQERLPANPTGQVSYENLSSIKYIVLLAKDLISSPSLNAAGGLNFESKAISMSSGDSNATTFRSNQKVAVCMAGLRNEILVGRRAGCSLRRRAISLQ
jgi:hypothetical protein